MQTDRVGANDLEDLAPGPGLPDAEILMSHCRPRAVRTCVTDQQLGKRVRASGGVRRHSPVLPCDRARERGSKPLAVSYRRSCCLDMKTPPEGGQVSDHM